MKSFMSLNGQHVLLKAAKTKVLGETLNTLIFFSHKHIKVYRYGFKRLVC